MDPLQQFELGETRYERVNDRWVCGRAANGEPCPIGPDGHGQCQVHLACIPYRDGDRYVCPKHPTGGLVSPERRASTKTCPGPLPDGRCPMMGLPCQPAHSLRARRGRWAFAAAAASFALALMLLSDPAAQPFVSPGPLTFQHHSSRHDCAACHAAGQGDLFANVEQAVADSDTFALHESQLCLKCHELGDAALFPHGVDPAALATVTERIQATAHGNSKPWILATASGLGRIASRDPQGQLNCSTCHREHRGQSFDLTAMTDRQCQSCHVGQFHSFSAGHPEFDSFPYQRRTRVHFDHSSHYGAHFGDFSRIMPDGHAPESCLTCHAPDPSSKTMPIRGFAESCASCHGPQIENHQFDGIAAFALPKLDATAFSDAGRTIGEWPTSSAVGIAELPPLMQLLLESDEQHRLAWLDLPHLDLRDLHDKTDDPAADQARAKAIERFAWAIKSLLHDIVESGPAGLEQRVARALSAEPAASELRVLAGRTSSGPSLWQSLAAAQTSWFPNLVEEIRQHRQGQTPETTAIELTVPDDAPTPSGGWHLAAAELRLDYHSSGHSDTWLRAWLDVTVRDSASETPLPDARIPAMQRFFKRLADPTSVHRCLDCHTVDSTPNGLQINWRGRHSHPSDHHFVKFSHAPHANLMQCSHCHQFDKDVTFHHAEFWTLRGGPTLSTNAQTNCTSGFERVNKSLCVECHNTQRVGDNCLKCHDYHTGHSRTVRP